MLTQCPTALQPRSAPGTGNYHLIIPNASEALTFPHPPPPPNGCVRIKMNGNCFPIGGAEPTPGPVLVAFIAHNNL